MKHTAYGLFTETFVGINYKALVGQNKGKYIFLIIKFNKLTSIHRSL